MEVRLTKRKPRPFSHTEVEENRMSMTVKAVHNYITRLRDLTRLQTWQGMPHTQREGKHALYGCLNRSIPNLHIQLLHVIRKPIPTPPPGGSRQPIESVPPHIGVKGIPWYFPYTNTHILSLSLNSCLGKKLKVGGKTTPPWTTGCNILKRIALKAFSSEAMYYVTNFANSPTTSTFPVVNQELPIPLLIPGLSISDRDDIEANYCCRVRVDFFISWMSRKQPLFSFIPWSVWKDNTCYPLNF